MSVTPPVYDLAELSAHADVSVRTVRYYIQQGLIPSPESRGPGAHYGEEHLDRLRLIKRLQREHLPLAEIRRRLDALAPGELHRLAEQAAVRPRSSARDYIHGILSEAPAILGLAEHAAPYGEPGKAASAPARSQWDRVVLASDVELHVRRPLSREQNRQVERLLQAARDIFEENLP